MPEKKLLTRDEVESHSSMLTNDRIDELIKMTTIAQNNVMSNKPDTIRAMEFFSTVWELYVQTQYFYDDYGANKEISNELMLIFKKELPIWLNQLWMKGNPKQEITGELVVNMIMARFIMIRGMQNLKYFTRFGKMEVKGLDAALRIFGSDNEEKTKDEDIKEDETNVNR